MAFKISETEVYDIMDEVKRLYYLSNTYMNNLIGKFIEENKIKILDLTISDGDEIKGEIEIVHIQVGITTYLNRSNKNINELREIINRATKYVIDYTNHNFKPNTFNSSKKFLSEFFEETNITDEAIIYFCAFYN